MTNFTLFLLIPENWLTVVAETSTENHSSHDRHIAHLCGSVRPCLLTILVSLWVGEGIRVHSEANSVSVIVSSSPREIFSVHPDLLTSERWQEVCSHLTFLARYSNAPKHTYTHARASFYRKFAEGKCTERRWNVQVSLSWPSEPSLDNKLVSWFQHLTTIIHHGWRAYRKVKRILNYWILNLCCISLNLDKFRSIG